MAARKTIVAGRAVTRNRGDLNGDHVDVRCVARRAGDIMLDGDAGFLNASVFVRRGEPISAKKITTSYLVMRSKNVHCFTMHRFDIIFAPIAHTLIYADASDAI
jgi:hypothetical protein